MGKFSACVVAALSSLVAADVPYDPRDLLQGHTMIADAYLDQPYCTILATGRWVCTVTDNNKTEGQGGEHVVVLWSDDRGETWSQPVDVEPSPVSRQLDNAYSMIIASNEGVIEATAAGATTQRVYVIYNMNVDNVTSYPNGQHIARVDMMGKFEMRYSDDAGETWSADRYEVPYRLTAIDYNNNWKGNTTIMWSVDQLKVRDGVAYFAFTKIGKYMLGPPEEWWLLSSDNILSTTNASDVTWTLLPHGEHGVRPIEGYENDNMEESHVVPLKDIGYPGLYVVGRTTMGWLAASSASDGNATDGFRNATRAQFWYPMGTLPTDGEAKSATCQGQLTPIDRTDGPFLPGAGLKNPRGPITMRRLNQLPGSTPSDHDPTGWMPPCAGSIPGDAPDKTQHPYLLLWYNNNIKTYTSRDPYFLSLGWEVVDHESVDNVSVPSILWSQPEVVLYDREDHTDRPGYPDFVQDYSNKTGNDKWTIYITETQKTVARLHPIDDALIQGLLSQHYLSAIPDAPAANLSKSATIAEPRFVPVSNASGPNDGFAFSFFLESQLDEVLATTQTTPGSSGIAIARTSEGIRVDMSSATTAAKFNFTTDPVCKAALDTLGPHAVSVSFDGAPLLLTLMVDGVQCDGGGIWDYGWAWVPHTLGSISGSGSLVTGASVSKGHVWTRPLKTSEQVSLHRSYLSK